MLTGSHASKTSLIFYGLSFYTASIAYLNAKKDLKLIDVFKFLNPILLFTGPIALFASLINHRSLSRSFLIFLPFLTIGLLYFQIIGAPLSAYMFLLNKTDLVSFLIFAFIFEIFVDFL